MYNYKLAFAARKYFRSQQAYALSEKNKLNKNLFNFYNDVIII